uniref:Peroxidase n=1 Tax=Oryza brachyantha TaxID=4533 RepID=J3M3R0_ORYBR
MTTKLVCLLVVVVFAAAATVGAGELKVGYYEKTCKDVEKVVNSIVVDSVKGNRGKGAGLVRLLFHDCFVRGCDASVLLEKSEVNRRPEKDSGANIGIRGMDVIDAIKAALEERCPNTVSCADIIAYAARDAARYLSRGGVDFAVPAGRLAGVVSRSRDADTYLPDAASNLTDLVRNFRRKNFTVEELVILSGAHSIGVTHCTSFSGRLTAPASQINPGYRSLLVSKCGGVSPTPSSNPTVVNNVRDEDAAAVARSLPAFVPRLRKAKDYMDNSYYHNNLAKAVTFHADWALLTGKEARGHVVEYAKNGTLWNLDFADALVKLSKLPMPAGSKGEIRAKCSAVNYHH